MSGAFIKFIIGGVVSVILWGVFWETIFKTIFFACGSWISVGGVIYIGVWWCYLSGITMLQIVFLCMLKNIQGV